jgi:hypothetical protein
MSSPTKSDLERFRLLQAVGCIACRLDGRKNVPADVHHLLSGGRRMGHQATIPLDPWHHRGLIPPDCKTGREAEERYGPSLAVSPKGFRERYGSEKELLETVNLMLDMLRAVAA